MRDSSKRNSRRNGGVAPYAKGESSPSSPSFSDSGDSVNSIKKLLHKDNSSIECNKKPISIKDGGGYVIKNEHESSSGNADGDFSGDLTNDFSGCVTSSSSNSNMYKQQTNNVDIVDSAKQHYMLNSVRDALAAAYEHQNNNSSSKTTAISSSSSSTARSESVSSPDACFSVPTSPTSLSTPINDARSSIKQKESANSVPTSPESVAQEIVLRRSQQQNGVVRKCDASGFRTSRSEDHLQHTQRDMLGAVVPIDIDEDVNSSLNTLLDTRHDSEDSQVNRNAIALDRYVPNQNHPQQSNRYPFRLIAHSSHSQQSSDRDRIVWTYNAPVTNITTTTTTTTTLTTTSYNNSHSFSSSISSSPQRSDSPASPTSVSSSIMSSNSGSKGAANHVTGTLQSLMCPVNGTTDQSVSEAVSNISSPDYQDDDNLLSSKDMAGMAISDPSDSDSTILVSDASHQHHRNVHHREDREHKIVIKVRGVENQMNLQGYAELKDSEDELATLTEDAPTVMLGAELRESSPPVSDDGSDVESLHSYHYSPKAVDMPSAVRLAKRLFGLEGFKKSDVSRHLSKK